MTDSLDTFTAHAKERFGAAVVDAIPYAGDLTLVIEARELLRVCRILRDDQSFAFEQLIDVCGVDYLHYGREGGREWTGARFAAVYHLLSLKHNRRVRLKVFLDGDMPMVDSVVSIWASANWYERETFDLFGIVFEGHPDLRRILTDYGFIGHPFRKDFPMEGHVEMRYDPDKQRVIYEPVSIDARVLVPRTIREEGFARG
jgi:NADH-quinone oxidoreductase subunit C